MQGEWRICESEEQSQVRFVEKVPEENILYISNVTNKNDEMLENYNDLTYWKPEDFENNELFNKNVVVWQWCLGVPERQGNIMRLSDKWWKPYLFEQNKEIEEAFNRKLKSTKITFHLIIQ